MAPKGSRVAGLAIGYMAAGVGLYIVFNNVISPPSKVNSRLMEV